MGSAPEEILRFSVVRNPQPVPSDKLRDIVVPIVPDDAGEDHPYYFTLLNMRRQNMPRRGILSYAEHLIANPRYDEQWKNLKTPLWTFVERLGALEKPTPPAVRDLIQDVFGQSAVAVASDERFRSDSIVIADSLILASVVKPATPGLRTQLMQARRAIAVIQRIGDREQQGEAERLERLLTATLLLPPAIFPIPHNNDERRDRNEQEYRRRREALELEKGRAQALLNQLSRNTAAAEEVSAALTSHLFETRHQPQDEGAPPASLTVLPRHRLDALSPAAREVVLKELAVPEHAIDVPYVVEQLEKKNAKLGHDLATNFGDLLLDAGPFNLPGCGECKPVVLPEPRPENNFTPDTRGEVEVVGTQDLLIVRQSLLDYRTGEIAHIENVLQGEQKSKKHRKLHRTEVTLVEETEKESEVENELQTTDKYELQTEASRVIQEDKSAEAGVTVTASYGTVNIEAHGNYASHSSLEESRRSASTFARDVVNRSLQRIRERVLKRRTRTDISEVEIINEHQFDNTDGTDHVTGVYRWVDKFYEAQIVNYGKRTMLEFMIPEPAAFYRFAASKKPSDVPEVPKPERPGFCRNGVFHPLTPADLQPENYMCFVGKYKVQSVTAPSPRFLRVSDLLKYKIDSTNGRPVAFGESNDSFKVPEGYSPKTISYTISGGNSHSGTTKNEDHDDIILAVVTIGDRRVFRYYKSEIGEVSGNDGWPDLTQVIEWGSRPLSPVEQQFGSYATGNLRDEFPLASSTSGPGDADVVKVSITGHTTLPVSIAVHYTVLCERTQAKFQQWQIDTFNAIQEAYLALKQEYDASRQSQEVAGLVSIQGRNPLLNREVEKRELKKFAISLLTGQQYESFNAMEEDYQSRIPQINLTDAAAEGKFVRFFEQALEWKHITYLFYPYFWGNKKRWTETVSVQDTDPLFEQFLQAGYARVWVPVRPGFDLVIANYIEQGGEPWTEKDAPIVGESAPFVALIEEIKEQLGADFEFRQGTLTVRNGDKRVVGSGTDFREDDKDREILIALKYYRIASVDEAAQEIRLREPYAGADQDGIGFAVGVKFVGEPWIVQVPTTLVYLTSGDDGISG